MRLVRSHLKSVSVIEAKGLSVSFYTETGNVKALDDFYQLSDGESID